MRFLLWPSVTLSPSNNPSRFRTWLCLDCTIKNSPHLDHKVLIVVVFYEFKRIPLFRKRLAELLCFRSQTPQYGWSRKFLLLPIHQFKYHKQCCLRVEYWRIPFLRNSSECSLCEERKMRNYNEKNADTWEFCISTNIQINAHT